MAAVDLGFMLEGQENVQAARAAYQLAIDSGHPDQAPKASVNLGRMLHRHEDAEGARIAFQLAIDSGNPDYVPIAAYGLGSCSNSKPMWMLRGRLTSRQSTPATPR